MKIVEEKALGMRLGTNTLVDWPVHTSTLIGLNTSQRNMADVASVYTNEEGLLGG